MFDRIVLDHTIRLPIITTFTTTTTIITINNTNIHLNYNHHHYRRVRVHRSIIIVINIIVDHIIGSMSNMSFNGLRLGTNSQRVVNVDAINIIGPVPIDTRPISKEFKVGSLY
ncbi:hypothetical protein RDWZM_001068 [Blomia tropicalis]|uniref:Uncharacterized protein n=1 Tax=Blomia tropicalis TaxID=40697 RepID=A0A9Q0MC44_BLOTA|nr:hypothetical protein RDWZM_001068 [Blomia tropicalis]